MDHVRLDVRVGRHGNFGHTLEDARSNARMFNSVATMVGLDSACFLTNADSLYQPYIGRGEALVALDNLFRGQASRWLTEHFRTCWRMIETLDGDMPIPDGTTLRDVFAENLRAQGTNIREFDLRVNQVRESGKSILRAKSRGYLSVNINLMRQVLVQGQASHGSGRELFSDPCGIELLCRPGQQVEADQTLARVRGIAMLEQIAGRTKFSIADTISVAPVCRSAYHAGGGFEAEWVTEGVT